MALVPVHKKGSSDLARLHRDMDDLLSGFFEGWNLPFFEHPHWPALDIAEEQDAFVVKAEIPGCKAEDIDISVHGDTLTISGEKKQTEEKKEKGYYHVERYYGNFRRQLNLPAGIDPDKVEAACADGVLTITLPKTEKAKPVKIKVKGQ